MSNIQGKFKFQSRHAKVIDPVAAGARDREFQLNLLFIFFKIPSFSYNTLIFVIQMFICSIVQKLRRFGRPI